MKPWKKIKTVWTLDSCDKQQCDVGLSNSTLVTQPWLIKINKICLMFNLCFRNLCIYCYFWTALFLTCVDARDK